MKSKSIAVIGGCGYIGSRLVPQLLADGHTLKVFDLTWFGNYLPKEVHVANRNAMSLTEADFEGFDTVIFLAGLSNDPMADYSPLNNFIENSAVPAYLAFIAKRAGVRRFINAGSCSVYGFTGQEHRDELSPALSNFPYGISKLMGEMGALQLCDPHFSVISLRQGTVSGYSPRMRLDLVVNKMVSDAVNLNEITVFNPNLCRPILAIQDAVSAYRKAILAPQEISGIFNVASGNFTVGQIAETVASRLVSLLDLKVSIKTNHISDPRSYKVNWNKASTMIQYNPSHNLESIITELVEHRSQFADYNEPRFYNILTFKTLDLLRRAL